MVNHRRLRVSVAAALMWLAAVRVGAAGPPDGSGAPHPRDLRIRDAIVDAVRGRMGDDAVVTIAAMDVSGEPSAAYLQAVPQPNARLGEPIHFRLLGAAGRGAPARVVGAVVASLSVDVEYVRARALVPRGRDLAEADTEVVRGTLRGVPLRRLPRLDEVAGTRVLVPLAPGEIVTRTAIALRPAVKSGHLVRATTRIAGLTVTASLLAAQDGVLGAIIRVVNTDSRRELRARVVEPGVVEVIP